MKSQWNEAGMPIRIWIKTVAVFFFIMVAIYFLLEIRDIHIGTISETVPDRNFYTNCTGEQPNVVILGSSLTNNALFLYGSFDSILKSDQWNIRYIALTGNSFNLSHFDDIIDTIRKHSPELIFIESNVVCVNIRISLLDKVISWLSYFRTRLARIPDYMIRMGGKAFTLLNNYASKPMLKPDKPLDHVPYKVDNIDYSVGKRMEIRTKDQFSQWNTLFRDAKQLDIRIVFLEVPRSKEAEDHLPLKFKLGFNRLIHEYKEQQGIDYIRFPYKLEVRRFYLDRAHLNRKGSVLYSEWLVKQILQNSFSTK